MSKARALTETEIKVVRQLIKLNRYASRDAVLFELLLNSLRVSECCNLKNSDVLNPDGSIKDELVIHSNMTKGKSSKRVPLFKATKKAIKDYLSDKSNSNFPQYPFLQSQKSISVKIHSNSAQLIIKKIFGSANIDNSSHFGRKTFAKLCFQNNIHPLACSSILGHSSASLTMKFYQECSAEDQKKVIDVLGL